MSALETFRRSMVMDYEKWHDGIGYDLDALKQLDPGEIPQVETLLIGHLKDPGDWRDVEALHALGTERAIAALQDARQHRVPEVRMRVVEVLGDPGDIERVIVSGLFSSGWSKALDLAEQNPTPAVKQALLECARRGAPEARVNAAAMLLYLSGQAEEPFDWNHRPFFLRFGEDNPADVQRAWDELRQRTGL